jgi:hypothetical protein
MTASFFKMTALLDAEEDFVFVHREEDEPVEQEG